MNIRKQPIRTETVPITEAITLLYVIYGHGGCELTLMGENIFLEAEALLDVDDLINELRNTMPLTKNNLEVVETWSRIVYAMDFYNIC